MRVKSLPKVSLFMETTKASPESTMSEIQACLRKYSLRQFVATYDGSGEIDGCFFVLNIDGRELPFKIPIRHAPLYELAKQKRTKYIRTEEQARRVAWRQVLRWIESQLVLVMVGMVDMQEVFLPYIMDKDGDTLYRSLSKGNFFNHYKALSKGEE